MWGIWALFVAMTDLVITKVLDPAVVPGDDIYHLEEFIRGLLPTRVFLSSVGSVRVVAKSRCRRSGEGCVWFFWV